MIDFDTILIANRGEIAARVIRTARSLGLRSVAVYSEADAGAPHVRLADEAVEIGPGPAAQSYLDAERILSAARETGAQAVHPGYGFLSENAGFARACAEAGLVFIGPPPEAIALMGDKAAAKRRMLAAGVPCVPGYEGEDQSEATLIAEAERIGLPLMVKAAAGGGGRGMRLVAEAAALPDALRAARAEAESAFGAGDLILERAVQRPRHVEIQVFADAHGNVIHLGERDCSVQRRHQKVLEEAPCPVMTPELRARMGEAAVEAARAIDYRGAGTVEFLLDESGEFCFLEMNTRLQVEHPVTEMVTGLDLVALQIQVAQGEALPLAQDDLRLQGHAIEARLYAEDPAHDFRPAPGTVELWRPAQGEGVRIDAGVETGTEVPPFYDPMIAKVIAHGSTRDAARRGLIAALRDTAAFGPVTNRRFLMDLLAHPDFAAGRATTGFIAENFPADALAAPEATFEDAALAALLLFLDARDRAQAASLGVPDALLDWSSSGLLTSRLQLAADGASFDVTVTPLGRGRYRLADGERTTEADLLARKDGRARIALEGRRREALFHIPAPGRLALSRDGRELAFRDAVAAPAGGEEAESDGRVSAPMPGALVELLAAEGARVRAGDRVAVLEAMKMRHDLLAPADGTVEALRAAVGDHLSAGQAILDIASD
ncbi:MAG: acetyl-CoA carboxylase biotin carboxylase subunit [Pseudomonadota bacterium]